MGTTYYVDPVNGLDTNNGTSVGTALKTISKAGTLAGPGDTVNLRGTGHFPSSDFDAANWLGTSGNVITVQSYPGETAVFDLGYPEFKSNPNTAWVPCTDPGAVTDEYISVNTYTTAETAYGTFLSSGDRLLNYDRVEDFRATNESFVKVPVSDPRPGAPIWGDTSNKFLWTYRGPGLWWDSTTKKIHFRASPTHYNQPGVTDYSGGSLGWAEGVAVFNTPYILKTQNLTAPAGAVTAQLYLAVTKNSAPGTAYFDDVFLAVTDNKVLNPHFEQGMKNWLIGRGTPTVTTDPTLARSATGAALLTGQTGTEYQELHQDITVTQGQVLFISGWIKTANWPAGKYAYLKAQWVNASHQVITTPWSTGKVDNTAANYTQVSTTLPAVPTGTAYVRPVLVIDGGASPGVAYFDDIYVR